MTYGGSHFRLVGLVLVALVLVARGGAFRTGDTAAGRPTTGERRPSASVGDAAAFVGSEVGPSAMAADSIADADADADADAPAADVPAADAPAAGNEATADGASAGIAAGRNVTTVQHATATATAATPNARYVSAPGLDGRDGPGASSVARAGRGARTTLSTLDGDTLDGDGVLLSSRSDG